MPSTRQLLCWRISCKVHQILMKVLKRFFEIVWLWSWHILVFIGVLLFCGHLWFISNSERALENTIRLGSNGKLNCSVKRFSLNYFTNVINIDDISIFNTDSTAQETAYRLGVHHFHLRIRSKWDLIFNSRLLIDSVIFKDPQIIITRAANRTKIKSERKILLVQELGNLYQTINNSLEVLDLDVFEIQEGKLLVKDAGYSENEPLKINHIYFRVNKLSINAENLNDKCRFHFSESIVLRVGEQNILLPDKHSKIFFKELLIDTKEKMLRVTAPKLNLLPEEDHKSSLNFEAKRVSILGLDFNSLYLHDLLKIDSFFLESPTVDLDFFRKTKTKTASARRTEIDSFIHRLPISVNIRHVVMQKGELTIKLHKSGKTTAFTTKNDDIAISDFHLNDHSDQGIRITGFKYTIRHYVGFSSDSTYRFDFDSLQFINSKIILYNLQITTANNARTKLLRNYVVPRFEITEMDWLSFILENHLLAKEAIMYDPILNLEKNLKADAEPGEKTKKKKSVYEFLSLFDKIIALEQLQIVNGTFNYKQSNNLNAHVQQLNLNICLKDLGKARTPEDLIHTFRNLSFDTATVHNTANFLSIHHSVLDIKKQKLGIDNLHFEAENNNIAMSLKGVEIQDFLIDSNILDLSSISWRSGIIHLNDPQQSPEKAKSNKNKSSQVSIHRITGNNTLVHFDNEKLRASVYFDLISADHFYKENGKPFQLDSLWLEGSKLRMHLTNGDLHGGQFVIRDKMPSFFENLMFTQKNNADSLSISIPSFHFIPNIKQTAQKEAIMLDSVRIVRPKFFFTSNAKPQTQNADNLPFFLPPLEFKGFLVEDAIITLNQHPMQLNCDPCTLQAQELVAGNDSLLYAKALQVKLNNFSFYPKDSLRIAFPGKAIVLADDASFSTHTQQWQILAPRLDADRMDVAIQHLSQPQQIAISGIQVTVNQRVEKDNMHQFMPWLINQSQASIRLNDLHWQKHNLNLEMHKVVFEQQTKSMQFDSFSFDPGKSREAFLKDMDYKRDYFQVLFGKTTLTRWSLQSKKWCIPHIETDQATIHIYVNKVKKPKSDRVKPMPVAMIHQIPLPLQIDTMQLNNTKVVYTEMNLISRDTGTISFNAVQGNVYHIQSVPGPQEDSLTIALHARFLDVFPLQLDLHESNRDSTGGMRLNLNIGSGDLEKLNAFLPQLSPVMVKSGILDSFQMQVTANDYWAAGKTSFYYHNLKGALVPKNPTHRPSIKSKLIHFLGNHVAIHLNKNRGNIHFGFARIREKSPVSYFLKMILEGAIETVSPLINRLYKKHRLKGFQAVS